VKMISSLAKRSRTTSEKDSRSFQIVQEAFLCVHVDMQKIQNNELVSTLKQKKREN
jgi:hypothetical protein